MDTPSVIRDLIIHHHRHNASERLIANMLNMPRSTVGDIIRKFYTTGSTSPRRRGHCGRKRTLGKRTERMVTRASVINPRATSREIQQRVGGPAANVSVRTIQRTLCRAGRVAYRPVAAPMLNRMFWGCLSKNGPGPLVPIQGTMNAARYVDILNNHVLPNAERFPNDWVLQHDNAPCHRARLVTNFLTQHGIQALPWPPYSPDMNVMENVWALLKRKVHRYVHTTRDDLIREVQNIWQTDPEIAEMCTTIVDSMHRRIATLTSSRGGYTGY